MGWQESLCGLAVCLRGPEHRGLVPAAARAVWVAGVLIMCSMQGTEPPELQEFTFCCVALQCSQGNGMCVGQGHLLIDVVFSGQILSMA